MADGTANSADDESDRISSQKPRSWNRTKPEEFDMTLLDELCELADWHREASEEERLILKMAICLLDQLEDSHGTRPRRVTFSAEDLQRVPGRWELSEGQLVP